MEICDAVGNTPLLAKDCLRSIVRRLNAQDPHIVLQAITVSILFLFSNKNSFWLLFLTVEIKIILEVADDTVNNKWKLT